MANQKIKWTVRKSQSSRGVIVVESKGRHMALSSGGNSVRIHCCSDAKIHILRGEH
jgi:hypothetical protein